MKKLKSKKGLTMASLILTVVVLALLIGTTSFVAINAGNQSVKKSREVKKEVLVQETIQAIQATYESEIQKDNGVKFSNTESGGGWTKEKFLSEAVRLAKLPKDVTVQLQKVSWQSGSDIIIKYQGNQIFSGKVDEVFKL